MQYNSRDWRDSAVTKAAAFAATGALLFGCLKLVKYADRKFCKNYGWLKNKPAETQNMHANEAFSHSLVNEGYRTMSVRGFLDNLQKCE